jgi:23S rRNA pseudouridine2605 synthase
LNELTENVEMVSDSAVRLNVFLQRHGVASRRKADSMILGGLVRINRKVVTTLGTRVQPGDRVSVNGRVLKAETPTMTYLFNKPDLCLTTRKDSRRRSTIFDIPTLRRLPLNVQPVGRLDFRSEGLLILTNDGNLAYALSHPRFHVEKTYAVLVSELFNPDDLERLRNGVELPDGFAKPLSVRLGGTEVLGGSRGQWLQVVVLEGRNRLVRRMLAAIGFKVVRLVRIGIGKIQLPDQLPPGQFIPVDGLVKDLLEKYRARVDGSPEGHDDSQSQADGKRTLSAKGTGAAPARSDSKSSESGWGERSRRQAAHSSKKQGGRSAPDRRRIQGEKKPETYARKKEAESMEMAKQTRLRKKRNEQKASVSK